MEASLALQKAIRGRLIAASAVTALVPAASIVDRNGKPATFPCVLIGEAQTMQGAGLDRRRADVYPDLHVWTTEPGTVQAQAIVGAIRDALADGPWTLDGHHLADLHIASTRILRDPDGLHAHGVVSITALLVELAA